MTAPQMKLPLAALSAIALTVLGAGRALAQCGSCTPPPPCCAPPTPPTPPNCNCGHMVNSPGVNVNVGATVIVNANAQAFASAGAGSGGQSTVFYGGGGGSWSQGEGSVGLIQGLQVEGESPLRESYQASRTKIRVVVIQAVCIDDQEIPHPASQVTPDRDIEESYVGELYRCIAGTHMQVTIADYNGQISFDHGQIITCQKNEALFKDEQGAIACRPQKPARDCNERSLLRRYGAGVKILKIVSTETYTAYREQTVQSASAATFNMTIDGGVGGVVH